MKIKVVVHEAEEGGYWAEVPSIPGCATQGESFEELLGNLYEAVEGCLSVDSDSSRAADPGVDRPLSEEINMLTCSTCGAKGNREEFVEEVFRIDGKHVLVDHIPASVCARCGEESFSRETTERVRLLVHGKAKPTKSIALKVFELT